MEFLLGDKSLSSPIQKEFPKVELVSACLPVVCCGSLG